MLLAGLSTSHKIGLAAMAAVFIAFSLVSAFVAPRRNPDFPSRGASVYYLVCVVLFFLMIGAVEIFGVEEEEAEASDRGGEAAVAPEQATIKVAETEWRVQLPSSTARTLKAGVYVFEVTNDGKVPHNLTIDGPGAEGEHTPNLGPGKSAELRVTLETGNYELYCSIPGHREQGMEAKLAVA